MFKKTILLFILAASQAFAQQSAPPSRGNDKLDIKKLEEKYWSAKDDDFSVVQNRRYTKAERYYLSVAAGVPFNDPYSTGTLMNAEVGYYFNERWGIQGSYTSGDLSQNDSVKQFVTNFGVIPDHNIFKSSLFLTGSFVPFYAKMSMMDRSIIYFDMGVSFGVGTLDYEIAQYEGPLKKSAFAYKLGIFQQIFFTENFAIRADLVNTWSTQDKFKYYAPGTSVGGTTVTGSRSLGTKNNNDTSVFLGITYWH